MIDDYEKLLTRAAQPTVDALLALQERFSDADTYLTCTAGQARVLSAALAEISEHFFDLDYAVADVKKAVGAGDWFSSLFRREIGLRPWPLIQECRMEAATRLLRDSTLLVVDVAFLVGYQAVVPFWRLTWRWCGMPPDAFRTGLRATCRRLEDLPDHVFTWHYWERCAGGQLSTEEVRQLIAYLEALYGPALQGTLAEVTP